MALHPKLVQREAQSCPRKTTAREKDTLASKAWMDFKTNIAGLEERGIDLEFLCYVFNTNLVFIDG